MAADRVERAGTAAVPPRRSRPARATAGAAPGATADGAAAGTPATSAAEPVQPRLAAFPRRHRDELEIAARLEQLRGMAIAGRVRECAVQREVTNAALAQIIHRGRRGELPLTRQHLAVRGWREPAVAIDHLVPVEGREIQIA